MTTESIYQKYVNAVQQVSGDGTWVDWGVVRLALRLAISDAYNGAPFTDLHALLADRERALQNALDHIDALRCERNAQPDQRVHERLQSQINRLNEWLCEHAPLHYREQTDTATSVIAVVDSQREQIDGLRQQLAQMDADNADLTKRCGSLRIELAEVMESRDHWLDQLAAVTEQRDAAQREIDRLTRENVIAVDTFNTLQEPATIHTNGNAPSRPAPTDWHVFLDDEANDWRISLDAGRRRFGDIPKLARLRIVQAILKGTQIDSGNTAAMPTMADYDAVRPPWAPVPSGVTKTFHCAWRDVLDLTEVPE